MQTIRFNKQAVLLLGALVVFLFCLFAIYTSSSQQSTFQFTDTVVRDAFNRQQTKFENRKHDESANEVEKKNTAKKHVEKIEETLNVKNDLIGKKVYSDLENDTNDMRRQKVKEMMIHAWQGYKNYSWGANELRPVAKTANSQNIFGGSQMPATIIDAADTLFIMDLMSQYKEARDYIEKNFSMSKSTTTLSVFETTIRMLGGFLSLHALTGETFYIQKAREVGEALLPAFDTPSGIPKSNLDVTTKHASNYGWANGGQSILAEIGTLHLEFVYLARLSNMKIFEEKVRNIRDVLERADKPNGLYSNYINPNTGKFSGSHVSVGALGDSFYEYLIKSYIQSNKTDAQAKKLYWEASEAIQKFMIRESKKSHLKYTIELSGSQEHHKMGHLACFVPGMFALQAINERDDLKKKDIMNLAEELGKTCHESYTRSETGIGPEMFYFNEFDEATSRRSENGYIQRPEVIEGWFYLWRLTGKQMYREWVWDAIQAIDKYCRVESGFTGLQNVYNPKAGRDDVQQSFFLAETLKYAYLTFADLSLISLNNWVFNTEAHPLPILDH